MAEISSMRTPFLPGKKNNIEATPQETKPELILKYEDFPKEEIFKILDENEYLTMMEKLTPKSEIPTDLNENQLKKPSDPPESPKLDKLPKENELELYKINKPGNPYEEPKTTEDNQKESAIKPEEPEGSNNKPKESDIKASEDQLNEIYHKIVTSNMIKKIDEFDGKSDIVASKVFNEENNKSSMILSYNKENKILTLISITKNKIDKANNCEKKFFKAENDLIFFSFTSDKNKIIAGFESSIVVWDYNKNKIKKKICIEGVTIDKIDNKIENYYSLIDDKITYIYYTVNQYLIRLDIKLEKIINCTLNSSYLGAEKMKFYINLEIKRIVAIGKTKMIIIDSENISKQKEIPLDKYSSYLNQEPKQCLLSLIKNDTLFVILGRLHCLKVSLKMDDKNITINEKNLNSGFCRLNNIIEIKDSMRSHLLVKYKPNRFYYNNNSKNNEGKCGLAFMDYKYSEIINEFEDYHNNDIIQFKNYFCYKTEYKVIFLTLSNFKVDPTIILKQKISTIQNDSLYVFITTEDNKVHIYRLPNEFHTNSITKDHLNEIEKKNPEEPLKKHIITSFCHYKDSENLKIYIEWKIDAYNSKNFIDETASQDLPAVLYEDIPILDTIEWKILACTECLLQLLTGLKFSHLKLLPVFNDIQENIIKVIETNTKSVPDLLNLFFVTKTNFGTPMTEYLPMFKFFDDEDSPSDNYFFGNSTIYDKEYNIKYSRIKLPDILGTQSSLDLTQVLCDIEDLKIFDNELIKIYIRSKWDRLRLGIRGITYLIWFNIFLIYSLIAKDVNLIYFYLFLLVNILLLWTEIIQAINLGIEDYLGIKEINYSSILQLLISIYITFFYSDLFVYGLFILTQSNSIKNIFESNESNPKNEIFGILIFCLPALLILFILIFTSNHFYFFIVIGSIEIVFYSLSFLGEGIYIGNQLGLQCLSIAFFIFYNKMNIYLFGFNMILLGIETIYIIFSVMKNNYASYQLFDYTFCLVGQSLVIVSFTSGDNEYAFLGLILLIIYTLIRTVNCYIKHATFQLKLMNFYCYRFDVYFLFAYIFTGYSDFAYSFVFLNILEFIWLRSYSYKTFIKDIIQLFLNWNTIDIIRYIVTTIWVINYWRLRPNQENIDKILTWVFVMLNLIKALLGFRAFDQTRFYVRLIFKCIVDIIPFLIIFVFFTFSFGLLNVVQKGSDDFETFWKDPLDQSVGGFTHNENETMLEYIMFSLGTLLIVIIMLNLLISLLGNTFENFLDEARLIDTQEMIETIYEVEVLLFWRKFDFKFLCFWRNYEPKDKNNSMRKIAVCDEVIPVEDSIQAVWQKKLNCIDGKIDLVINENKKAIDEVKNEIKNLVQKFDSIFIMKKDEKIVEEKIEE